jgi:hypothetical protein
VFQSSGRDPQTGEHCFLARELLGQPRFQRNRSVSPTLCWLS